MCDALGAPTGPFDAATAFLCLRFVPDDGSRLEQLRAIHQRLKPGAPFLMMRVTNLSNVYGWRVFSGGDFKTNAPRTASLSVTADI